MRSAGSPTSRPNTPATSAPSTSAISNGRPRPCTSRRQTQPPTPASANCASDTMPSCPYSSATVPAASARQATVVKVLSQ